MGGWGNHALPSVLQKENDMREIVAAGGGTDFVSIGLPYPISGSAARSFK